MSVADRFTPAPPAEGQPMPVMEISWLSDLMEIFMRNQVKLAPVMPLLVLLMTFTTAQWVSLPIVAGWAAGALGCCAVQLFLCHSYFKAKRTPEEQQDWIGMIAASELFQGMFWVLPLFFFWPNSDSLQNTFLVASIIAVSVVRLLIVSNFMPVLIAGTGVMTIGVAVRCVAEGNAIYLALAGLLITLEVFYLFVARHLQDTIRDMLIFRRQKEELIVELKAARDRAEDEKSRAENANRAKSSFLANMSHELRTPLNAILGFSEVLEREMFGPLANRAYKDYAGDINSSGRYLLGLINDILDLSRIEAGRVEMKEEPLNMATALEHAKHLLGIKAAEKDTFVEISAEQGVPKVMADARALNQIAINLLTNAIKFSPTKGRITMSVKRVASGAVTLSVRDNGPGIPHHEIQHALSAFARGSHATKKAIEGAGLGLPIVKGLMEIHGGTLDIISEPGRGTDVICTFPPSRVLSGPRNGLVASEAIASETQRKLISLTG
jgi:two-component system, cell cycle sensor histidine kinase PleC